MSQYLVLYVQVTLEQNLRFKYTVTFYEMKWSLDTSEFRVPGAFNSARTFTGVVYLSHFITHKRNTCINLISHRHA